MKILNKQEFLAMPEGTLYSLYVACYFGKMLLKGPTIGNTFKVVELSSCLTPSVNTVDMLIEAENGDIDLPMDSNAATSFDEISGNVQLYAVWTKDDIDTLIATLVSKSRLAFDKPNLKQKDWINDYE